MTPIIKVQILRIGPGCSQFMEQWNVMGGSLIQLPVNPQAMKLSAQSTQQKTQEFQWPTITVHVIGWFQMTFSFLSITMRVN